MKNGYLAGPLFNEAEVSQRLLEGQMLRAKTGEQIDWFNPIEQPINDKDKLPTATDIFGGDTMAVIHADYVMADITNNDVGVAMELGISYGLQYARMIMDRLFANADEKFKKELYAELDKQGVKYKMIYAVNSDIRLATAGKYDSIHIPYGINQYMIGGLESMNCVIYNKFDAALDGLAKQIAPKEDTDAK
jgi:nucleoside 2-deoxyribosyltransferase